MSAKPLSIRRQLSRRILLLVLGAWLLAFTATIALLSHEINEMMDEELQTVADTVALSLDAGGAGVIPRSLGLSPDTGERVLRILRPGAAVPPAPSALPGSEGLHSQGDWRVLRPEDLEVVTNPDEGGALTILLRTTNIQAPQSQRVPLLNLFAGNASEGRNQTKAQLILNGRWYTAPAPRWRRSNLQYGSEIHLRYGKLAGDRANYGVARRETSAIRPHSPSKQSARSLFCYTNTSGPERSCTLGVGRSVPRLRGRHVRRFTHCPVP